MEMAGTPPNVGDETAMMKPQKRGLELPKFPMMGWTKTAMEEIGAT